jgi:protein gp37
MVTANQLNAVIAGGASGPHARPMDATWLRGLRDTRIAGGVPFFFKQWGGVRDARRHEQAVLDGRRWTEFPQPVCASVMLELDAFSRPVRKA